MLHLAVAAASATLPRPASRGASVNVIGPLRGTMLHLLQYQDIQEYDYGYAGYGHSYGFGS